MTCRQCGHVWTLLRAHIIQEQTPAGCRESVQCPACGQVTTVVQAKCDGE
jgi:hypothetical protein